LREYAEIFFQLPARVEKPMELKIDDAKKQLTRKVPIGRRLPGYETQYDAGTILDSILLPRIPKDAVVYLGITMQDLYADDLNYVFGLGSERQRVGVYSFVRYFPEFWNQKRQPGAEKTALLRACKVLNHETGHMFGLSHCVFYNCSMNGSMSCRRRTRHRCISVRSASGNCSGTSDSMARSSLRNCRRFIARHELKEDGAFYRGAAGIMAQECEGGPGQARDGRIIIDNRRLAIDYLSFIQGNSEACGQSSIVTPLRKSVLALLLAVPIFFTLFIHWARC